MQTYENVANRIDRFASRCRNRDQSIFSGGGGDASFPSSAISSGVTDGCSRGELRAYQAHKTMMMTAGNAGQNRACCPTQRAHEDTTTGGVAAAASCRPIDCKPWIKAHRSGRNQVSMDTGAHRNNRALCQSHEQLQCKQGNERASPDSTAGAAAGEKRSPGRPPTPINVNILRAPRRCPITPPGNWKAA